MKIGFIKDLEIVMDGSELKNGPVVGEVNQKDCQALRSV
jgi:hypothetical protein